MGSAGRNFLLSFLFLTGGYSSLQRAKLAQESAEAEKPCQGFTAKGTAYPHLWEEANGTSNSSACRASRFAFTNLPSEDEHSGAYWLELPMPAERGKKWPEPQLLQQLRSPLYENSLVAANQEQTKVSEQETEGKGSAKAGRSVEQGEGERGINPTAAVWTGGNNECSTMGDHNTDPDSFDDHLPRDRNGDHSGRQDRCGEGGFLEAGPQGEGSRGHDYLGTAGGDRECDQRPATTARFIAQIPQSTTESGEGTRQCQDADCGPRYSVDSMAGLHDEEVRRTSWTLPRKTESADGEIHRGEGQGDSSEARNRTSSLSPDTIGYHRCRGLHGPSSYGLWRSCGGGPRDVTRGRRQEGCRDGRIREGQGSSSSRRRTTSVTQQSCETKVTFNNEVMVTVYEAESMDRQINFLAGIDELCGWDSKPWALYPGAYTTQVGRPMIHGGDYAVEIVNEINYEENEEQGEGWLHHGEQHGEGVNGARDAGQIRVHVDSTMEGEQPAVVVHTFGLEGGYLGRRSGTFIQDGFEEERKLRELIRRLWPDHYNDETSYFLPTPQPEPEDEGHATDLYMVVDFMDLSHPCHAGRVASLVDIKGWDEETNLQVRSLEGAMILEQTTWYGIVNALQLQELCRQRTGNQCMIRIGYRLILDDHYVNIPDECLLTVNYQVAEDDPERLSLLQLGHQKAIRSHPAHPTSEEDTKRVRLSETGNGKEDQQQAGSMESHGTETGAGSSGDVIGENTETTDRRADQKEAHLFHLSNGYIVRRLDAADPIQRHVQVALAWGIPLHAVQGLHPLRARPPDLNDGKEALITRWTNDQTFRLWPNDVLVLLDLDYTSTSGTSSSTTPRRTVRWCRHQITRLGILRWLGIEDYCRREARTACRLWINNREWMENVGGARLLQMGDYIRVLIPSSRDNPDELPIRRLRQLERLQVNNFFPSSSDGENTQEEEEEEEECSDGSGSTGRRTLPEPEPHDVGQFSLATAITGAGYRPTKLVPPSRPPEMDNIDFSEVISLFSWMDHASVIPAWTLPTDAAWHEATHPWMHNDWWSLQAPEELWFYTDGSRMQDGAGSAIVLFVRSNEGWHYGGYLGQGCPKKCAHLAELQAIAMGFQWTYSIMSYCAAMGYRMPTTTFAFDATSAGYKAFGFWGSRTYDQEASNLRSLWAFVTQRFDFNWHLHHVQAHQGDPGNEAANTLAQIAAEGRIDRRSSSVWAEYSLVTVEPAIHWLWTLWKSEWTPYWQGTALCLPTLPTTTPDGQLIDKVMNKTTISTTTSSIRELTCTLATANVLTLLPGKAEEKHCGLHGMSRSEGLQKMFEEAGVHIVGLQETRIRKLPKCETDKYYVLGGAATTQGHYGVQIWFSKTLDVDCHGGRCYFQKSHLRIIHQDPRKLIVSVNAPFMKTLVVCAHGPHGQAPIEERRTWWKELDSSVPTKYQTWPRFLLADANARVGDFPQPCVGDYQAECQDQNGEFLCEYLQQNDVWLPSTYESFQTGDGGTWYHQQSNKWVRGDYVGIPTSWQLQSCACWVMDEVDLSLKKQDHRPAAATIKWAAHIQDNQQVWKGASSDMPDSATIMKDLVGPDCEWHLQELQACLPHCDWTTDVHTHTALIQQGLQSWARARKKRKFCLPMRKAMSDSTWILVQKKRDIRQKFFRNHPKRKLKQLRFFFQMWRDGTSEEIRETKEEAIEAAQDWHNLQRLSREVTRALRQDDKNYFTQLMETMGDPTEKAVTISTWKSIKWALPKVRQKRKQSPFLLATLDDQWHQHFATLEAGEMLTDDVLLQRCDQRQKARQRGGPVDLQDLLTLNEVEASLRGIEPHKAPGPDKISNAVYKYGAPILAKAVHDVYTKSVMWEMEPLQNKGGLMYPIHKSGSLAVAKSYRGVMLLNTLSKCFHALLRKRVMEHLSPLRMESQLGGFEHQQAQFGAQCIQTVGRISAAKGLSMAALFVDVRGAYHYLIRELVLGIENVDDFQAIIQALETEEAETRGVKLWSQIPGLLQRIGTKANLVSLLRELHQDTWAQMAHLPGTIRSRRGTRPGSPLADAIFHALMMDLHIEVHRILENDSATSGGFKAANIQECAVTWADDLAVPVIVEDADTLVPTLQRVAEKIHTAFENKGLLLNMSRNKTAAVLSFRGPSAPARRREYLLHSNPGCMLTVSKKKKVWLHFTGNYKHLGSIFCAEGHMTREVQARLGMASSTFRQLRRPIFTNGALAPEVKLKLLDALVLSQLFYGLATWNQIGEGLLKKIESFVLKCQRQVCRFPLERTNDEFRGLYRLPTIEARLTAARLQYVARIWTVGPNILRSLLHCEDACTTTGWLQSVRVDLEWYQDVMESRSLLLAADIDCAAVVWREDPHGWKKSVKRAYHRVVMQEALAADVRGWHHIIFSDIQRHGGELDGAMEVCDAGVYQCFCGQVCKTSQGLAAHQRFAHQHHAPEHPYITGPSCPVCLKWLWTKNRVRLHLSYIPRGGGPNRCFNTLRQSGWQQEPDIEEDHTLVSQPSHRGMRLDALQGHGPERVFERSIDKEINETEETLTALRLTRSENVQPEEVDTKEVERISYELTRATTEWWEDFQRDRKPDGGAYLCDTWVGILFMECETARTQQAREIVFREWGDHILPTLTGQWMDGEAEKVTEDTFYEVVQEFETYALDCDISVKSNRLRRLHQRRREEDDQGPHRPARFGPTSRRGGGKGVKRMVRKYLDEDGWHRACKNLRWSKAVPDNHVATMGATIYRPCFLILHLFSGRRRHEDIHDAVMTLARDLNCDVHMISLDTAVDFQLGDLSSASQTWQTVMQLARQGRVAAAIAGPPCETYSEARFHVPEDIPEHEKSKWPRPLRSYDQPWGVEGLRYKEMKQLQIGTRFGLQMLWLFTILLCQGGSMIIEHPAPTRKPGRAALFTMPLVEALLSLPEVVLYIIRQSDYGAKAIKPTGLLTLRVRSFWKSMRPWKSPTPANEIQPKIGRYRDGTFRTSELKEYPTGLSWSLAQCIVDSLKVTLRNGQWRSNTAMDEKLLAWCNKAHQAAANVDDNAPILPDYQER